MIRSMIGVCAAAVLLTGCATKWNGAPSMTIADQDLDTKITWLQKNDGQYDLLVQGKNFGFLVPQKEIHDSIVDAAENKAKSLCSPRKAIISRPFYNQQYYQYEANVICR